MRPFQPMPLVRLRDPFDHADWLFELKYDGFRALAIVRNGRVELVSRRGIVFRSFPTLAEAIGREFRAPDAILDGEIVCLDDDGHPEFLPLLFRRADPFFQAFDLLSLDGEDMRESPLIERKRALRSLIARRPLGRLRSTDHVNAFGVDLYERACLLDLEGIVAKPKESRYQTEPPQWVKIKNPAYTQARDRHELFEQRTTRRRA